MKLTKASSYALHAVAYLAANKPDKAMASHNLAKECNVKSDHFLLKVLKLLVTARILTSMRSWRSLEDVRAEHARNALREIAAAAKLSADVSDIVERILKG